ncbi:NUDIX domain-containing protein [Microbacteriaceae bacterium 4G12]
MSKRGKVWLAVSGLVITEDGRWLVVKKNYGGLQGKWSLPAGFVNGDETIDQAVKREILEETGIDTEVVGVIGIRSGVIRGEISDNMVLFLLKPKDENIVIQEKELAEAVFLQPHDLAKDESTSVLVHHLLNNVPEEALQVNTTLNPGDHFGYTAYHLFL